jgi:phenylpyruvate tautomerase PptA (4-oxalocrotonate tautomerase family)
LDPKRALVRDITAALVEHFAVSPAKVMARIAAAS